MIPASRGLEFGHRIWQKEEQLEIGELLPWDRMATSTVHQNNHFMATDLVRAKFVFDTGIQFCSFLLQAWHHDFAAQTSARASCPATALCLTEGTRPMNECQLPEEVFRKSWHSTGLTRLITKPLFSYSSCGLLWRRNRSLCAMERTILKSHPQECGEGLPPVQ